MMSSDASVYSCTRHRFYGSGCGNLSATGVEWFSGPGGCSACTAFLVLLERVSYSTTKNRPCTLCGVLLCLCVV